MTPVSSPAPQTAPADFASFVENSIINAYDAMEKYVDDLLHTPYICDETRYHAIKQAYKDFTDETVCYPSTRHASSFKPA